ncbi:hypothetical protein Acr_15g0002490 [Actinidia rufa]|uniref:ELM2 domain-containing protein n=1 Tax=Actinidia rufa TaxID=165716 RepID=A0A7J0FU00_9ERIC|nr:hypothetical protein Acr_15g0002490 [Actinidia rufa]
MLKPRKDKKPTPVDWVEFITDENHKLAIPCGSRFQVDLSDWTGPPHEGYDESSTSRWLGTKVWPIEDAHSDTNVDLIGKGRSDSCTCPSPGSIECVKHHVNDKKVQLQSDLDSAFGKWRFNEMGEGVSDIWSSEEQKQFDCIVKMNPASEGKSFLKPAMECFRTQRETILSYYFNVYVPRCMSNKARAGSRIVDSDDDEEGEDSKSSQKRSRADDSISRKAKYARNRYLTGIR